MTTDEGAVGTGTSGSRAEIAYGWLLAQITGFRVRTGSPLSENKIAAQLDISRTPVREALQRLEKEGLVKRTDNARFAVSQINSHEVNDACDMLEALDTYIFRKAASKLTDADTAKLLASVEQMARAARSEDRVLWSDADTAFHRLVNTVADNPLIADTVKHARRRVQRFWLRAASMTRRLESCSHEHRVLANAMIAQDYDAIGPAVTEHIGHMRASMLDMLASAAMLGDE